MKRCWIGVGSNLDREVSIRAGVRDLRQRFGALTISPVFETQAVGTTGPPFFNLVVGIHTTLSVSAITALLHAIEQTHGRVRTGEPYAPRTLDLDLLTYGEMTGIINGYRLPRAEILDYGFVLAPLAMVAPEERHPERGLSYAHLWNSFDPGAHGQVVPKPVILTPPLTEHAADK